MNRQQAMGKLASLVDNAKKFLDEAKALADENELAFEFANEEYGRHNEEVYKGSGVWWNRWDDSGCSYPSREAWDDSGCSGG